jgi:tRNA (Thr-GGU) A37 N-methylase
MLIVQTAQPQRPVSASASPPTLRRWLVHQQEWTVEVIEALRDAIRGLGERSNHHVCVINEMHARTIDVERLVTKLAPALVAPPTEH